MFCKFCGETINRDTMECSRCGRPAGHLSGGVGFWDLAAPTSERPSVEKPAAASDRELTTLINDRFNGLTKELRSENKGRSKLALIVAGALGLVLVLNIVLICLVVGLSGSQEMLSSKLHSLGVETNETDVNKAPDGSDATEAPADASEAPTQTVPPTETIGEDTGSWLDAFQIEITKSPSSSPVDLKGQRVGTYLPEPKMLFTLEAKGEDVMDFEFHWQRFNEDTGRWEDITDGAYVVKNTVKDGITAYSALYLERITENVVGEYRCLVENPRGYQIPSDPAVLSPMNAPSAEDADDTGDQKGGWKNGY